MKFTLRPGCSITLGSKVLTGIISFVDLMGAARFTRNVILTSDVPFKVGPEMRNSISLDCGSIPSTAMANAILAGVEGLGWFVESYPGECVSVELVYVDGGELAAEFNVTLSCMTNEDIEKYVLDSAYVPLMTQHVQTPIQPHVLNRKALQVQYVRPDGHHVVSKLINYVPHWYLDAV